MAKTDLKKKPELEDDDDLEVDLSLEEDETDDDDLEDEDDLDDKETDDDSEDDSDDEDEDSDDADSDEDEEDDEDDSEFTKRFTQFKGETPAEYAKNLEDAYTKSGKEAVRLSKEVKELQATVGRVNQLIATNPELAKQLAKGGGTGQAPETNLSDDPAVNFAKNLMKETHDRELSAFTTEHPEIETDPELADALNTQLVVVRDVIAKTQGRLVGMKEGLDMAWKLLGKDTNNDDRQERIRMAAKSSASQGKAGTGKKSKSGGKPKFTESQINLHMEIAAVDRDTAIKQLSKYNK